MKALNLVLVCDHIGSGGVAQCVSRLSHQWTEAGHHVHVVHFHPSDTPRKIHLNSSISETQLSACGIFSRWRSMTGALRSLNRDHKIDFIISFLPHMAVYTFFSSIGLGAKRIATEHLYPAFEFTERNLFWKVLRIFSYLFMEAIVVLNQKSADFHHWLFKKKIWIIPHAFDLEGQTDKVEKISTHPFVLSVGRLERQKRMDLVIESFHRLAGEFPDLNLIILGTGTLRNSLNHQIKTLGMENRISILDQVADPFPFYQQARFLVMASDFEGFSLVALEAIACGKAVIFTNCLSGPSELVQDGLNGFLVPVGSVDCIVLAMKKLLNDSGLLERMGRESSSHAQQFSWRRISHLWEALFTTLS